MSNPRHFRHEARSTGRCAWRDNEKHGTCVRFLRKIRTFTSQLESLQIGSARRKHGIVVGHVLKKGKKYADAVVFGDGASKQELAPRQDKSWQRKTSLRDIPEGTTGICSFHNSSKQASPPEVQK